MLNTEMDEHLGGRKSNTQRVQGDDALAEVALPTASRNPRNGYSPKTIQGDMGKLPLEIPRDRLNETEGAKFWLSCLTDLKNRGLNDIFMVCVDSLSGFPEAIQTAYPKAKVQSNAKAI